MSRDVCGRELNLQSQFLREDVAKIATDWL